LNFEISESRMKFSNADADAETWIIKKEYVKGYASST
jgi:hypothetical protein